MNETTGPLEQAVMEAAVEYAKFATASCRCNRCQEKRERLRLHVRLSLSRARYDGLIWASGGIDNPASGLVDAVRDAIRIEHDEIAALEARLQEE